MNARFIDMTNDPRRDHFNYFSQMAYPYVGITAQVDVSDLLSAVKTRGLPFFLSFLYCAGQAANAVPQLRRRILDGQVIEFDRCDTSHTVLRDNGAYCYCRINPMQAFEVYLPEARLLHAAAKQDGNLEDGEDALSLIFISCLPWLHYTQLTQPVPMPADSNPRITWGKYVGDSGRIVMPVTLQAHHALVDGLHIAAFYEALNEALSALSRQIESL